MMEALYEVLDEEYQYQQLNGYCNVEVDGLKGFIFMNPHGGLYKPENVNAVIRRAYTAYNVEENSKALSENRNPVMLPHFTAHNLRHTFCSRLCENEPNIKLIQSVMGHSSIKTTMDIYTEINETKKKEAIQNLSHKLNNIF